MPNIGLAEAKFKFTSKLCVCARCHSSCSRLVIHLFLKISIETKWSDIQVQRQWFIQFAKLSNFAPDSLASWYSLQPSDILESKVITSPYGFHVTNCFVCLCS